MNLNILLIAALIIFICLFILALRALRIWRSRYLLAKDDPSFDQESGEYRTIAGIPYGATPKKPEPKHERDPRIDPQPGDLFANKEGYSQSYRFYHVKKRQNDFIWVCEGYSQEYAESLSRAVLVYDLADFIRSMKGARIVG